MFSLQSAVARQASACRPSARDVGICFSLPGPIARIKNTGRPLSHVINRVVALSVACAPVSLRIGPRRLRMGRQHSAASCRQSFHVPQIYACQMCACSSGSVHAGSVRRHAPAIVATFAHQQCTPSQVVADATGARKKGAKKLAFKRPIKVCCQRRHHTSPPAQIALRC